MSTLVTPLVSGIAGAESGTARFYEYGTNYQTPAVAYDVDGVALGTSVTLDSNGGAECYVYERVQVLVEDTNGDSVRTFALQSDDASSMVASASFTGTDPDTGAQVAGGETLARTTNDAIYTSFGARDWKVRPTGSTADQYLKDALSFSASNSFFDVTAAAYGAVGDGITDDGTAIQSAINAAVTAGGGVVFFPSGTYKIGSSLSISSQKVVLLGAGHRASEIRNSSTASGALSISSGASTDCGIVIENLAIVADTTSTGVAVTASVCHGIEFRNTRIEGHLVGIKADSRIRFLGGTIDTVATGTAYCIQFDSAGSGDGSEILGAKLTNSSVSANQDAILVQRADVRVTNCTIDVSACAATSHCIHVNNSAGTSCSVSGNRFIAGGSNYGFYIAANVPFYEDGGNRASSGTTFGASAALTTATPQVRVSRMGSSATATQSGGTYNVNQDIALHYIENTNAAGGTVTIVVSGGTPTHGQRLTIMCANRGGGAAQSLSTGASTLYPTGTVVIGGIGTGQGSIAEFVYNAGSASPGWDIICAISITGPYVT